MANKRDLKKYMKVLSANLAGDTLFIVHTYNDIDINKAEEIIYKIRTMLTENIAKVSVAFDKTCSESFNNERHNYRKAHRKYYKECYQKLLSDFHAQFSTLLKEMNSLLSPEQLEENKKMA